MSDEQKKITIMKLRSFPEFPYPPYPVSLTTVPMSLQKHRLM